MLRNLDRIALALESAWACIKNPELINEEFIAGIELGKEIGFAEVRHQFDTYDPHQIDNAHFQMGYYYAVEQAKKVMPNDENRSVA